MVVVVDGPSLIERGEKALTPTLSVLLRKRPVLLRPDFVLTTDPRPLYYKSPLVARAIRNAIRANRFARIIRN